jgi:predicted transcriptional regulator
MESRGWVRPVDGTYELTALGEAILSAYEEFRDHERTASRLRPFLKRVPATAFDLGPEALAGATVVSSGDDPTAFVDRLVDLRAEASAVREYTPYLLLDSVRQLAGRVDNGEPAPDLTLVLGTDSPPESSAEYADRFETLADASSVEVRLYPDGPPIGFGVADGRAFIGVADEDGMPHTLLVSDAPEVVSWAERRFADCLDAGEPIPSE